MAIRKARDNTPKALVEAVLRGELSNARALPELLSRIEYRSADQFTEATLNGDVIHVGNFATLKQTAQVLFRWPLVSREIAIGVRVDGAHWTTAFWPSLVQPATLCFSSRLDPPQRK